jgi:hypothetical protein
MITSHIKQEGRIPSENEKPEIKERSAELLTIPHF